MQGREAEFLGSCYRACLELALANKVETIAFPSISTGVYGYPIIEAAPIAIETVQEWVVAHPDALNEVRFVLHSKDDFGMYQTFLAG